MKNIRILIKMAVGIGLLLLLILVSGGWSIRSLNTIDNQILGIQNVFMPLTESSSAVQVSTMANPVAMNNYLLTGSQEA